MQTDTQIILSVGSQAADLLSQGLQRSNVDAAGIRVLGEHTQDSKLRADGFATARGRPQEHIVVAVVHRVEHCNRTTEDGVTTTSKDCQEHTAVTVVHWDEHCNRKTDRVKKMVLLPPVGTARNTLLSLLSIELNTATEQTGWRRWCYYCQ